MVRVLRKTRFSYLSGKAKFFRNGSIVLLISGTVIMLAVPHVGFLLGVLILALAMKYWREYSNYDAGMKGERLVSKALEELNDTYFLLEDVSLASWEGNIDHVLVGTNGIFVIEVKNYRGRLSVHIDKWYHTRISGAGKKEIRSISIQVKKNAANLNKILKDSLDTRFKNRLFVEPVIVFSNKKMKLKTKEPTVLVVTLDKLIDTVRTHTVKHHYSTKEAATIARTIQQACDET